MSQHLDTLEGTSSHAVRLPAAEGLPPHAGQPVLRAGEELPQARGAVILVHGRGASAASILGLAPELRLPDHAFLAPQAAGSTWYPASFMAPREINEPGITSGLERLETLVQGLAAAGIPARDVALLGFSQGACLVLEFVARHPRRYRGVAGLTGGLIGPPGSRWETQEGEPLAGTPLVLSGGDPDPHVPRERVEESARVLGWLGADVDLRIYPGRPHTIIGDEIEAVRAMLAGGLTARQAVRP